ncbi:MAG TPA: sigma-70 family RNA polymerase sigma factor [Bryobacteraceae bacterium]|nr:sigma-70 family RNA polymerase sigma factor [Bryobacteraceae bacterium]
MREASGLTPERSGAFKMGTNALPKHDPDRLIEAHRTYSHAIAAEMAKALPHTVDRDDLIGAAELGLVEAARNFDPSRGVLFKTFAYYRIRGAIYDSLRKLGLLKNAPRLRFEAGANEVLQEYASDSPPAASDAQSAWEGLQTITETVASVYVVSLDALVQEPADVVSRSPEEKCGEEQDRRRVRAALAALPPKNRQVIEDYYYNDCTLEDIGRKLGLSKSWVCRLHARSLEMLRAQLDHTPQKAAAG